MRMTSKARRQKASPPIGIGRYDERLSTAGPSGRGVSALPLVPGPWNVVDLLDRLRGDSHVDSRVARTRWMRVDLPHYQRQQVRARRHCAARTDTIEPNS